MLEKIASRLQCRQFDKADLVVTKGKTSKQIAFIEEGSFQYFSLAGGVERTTYISLQHSFVASLLSYLNEVSSRENMRALTKAILWVINKQDAIRLQQEIPAFKDFYINLSSV